MENQNNNIANNDVKYNFASFYEKNNVEIPLIQRDYVQGSNRQQEKRDAFIDALFAALIDDENNSCELDFIYGTFNHGAFIPLDGQQRLTTLYLLHWFLINKCRIENTDKYNEIVKDFKLESHKFSYMTRRSSSYFCSKLNEYMPAKWPKNISSEIISMTWFSENWKQDPSVMAMLDMLDALNQKFNELPNSDVPRMLDVLLHTNKINFDCLDMGEYKLTDSLYVKMNARGKQLTEFENWKAKFIQFLEDSYNGRNFVHTTGTNKHLYSNVKDYYTYSIEHDWTDLFWSYAVKDYRSKLDKYNELSDEKKKMIARPESPLIDKFFLNFYYYIFRMQSLLDEGILDMENEAITNGTEKNRKAIFSQFGNIELLFRSLDAFALIAQNNINGCVGFFNELFYLDGRKTDGSVRLFASERTDLFESCIINYASVDEQVLLYCIIKYCIKQQCYTVTDELKKYVRVCRNLIESINQRLKKDMKIHSNVRLADLSDYIVTIDDLCSVKDVATLPSFSKGMGDVESVYTWMKLYPNNDVYLMEDSGYTHGCMNAFDDKANLSALRKAFDAFRGATDIERTRILVAYDYKGSDFGSCAHGSRVFFGYRDRWDVLFRYKEGIGALKNSFQRFANAFSFVGSVEVIINNKLKAMPCMDCFNYYFLKYDGFANSALWGTMDYYSSLKNVDAHHFFAIKSEFDVITLPRFSSNPLLGYHTDPYAAAVAQIIRKNHPDIYESIDYTGENKNKARLSLDGKNINLLCTDYGWLIEIMDVNKLGTSESVHFAILNKIYNKCCCRNNSFYFISSTMDRVQSAVYLIEEIYK